MITTKACTKKSKVMRKRKKSKINKYKIAFIILFVLSILFLLFVQNPLKHATKNNKGTVKTIENKFTMEGELFFLDKTGRDTIKTIAIEIADTEYDKQTGLMHRYSMPDSLGMLFIFEKEEPQSFWMKNTYISLDIIFLNKDMEITTIQKHTEPLTEWPIPSDKPAKYIIEVNAGFCDMHNINNGVKVKYDLLNLKR
jgi:uncharacterized membrane protein (UPF0127 family)